MSFLGTIDYPALADLRYQIRRFLRARELTARAAGVEPQQYMLLLQVKGLEGRAAPTIGALAERLQISHHGVVQLVDRLVERRMAERRPGADRREVVVRLRPRGETILRKLARHSLAELTKEGPGLVASLRRLIQQSTRSRTSSRNGRGKDRRMMRHGLVLPALMVGLLLVGCAKSPVTTSSAPSPTGSSTSGTSSGSGDRSGALGATSRTGTSSTSSMGSTGSGARVDPREYSVVGDLADVHFDFDKYEIQPAAATMLDGHAAWLKKNADRLILIEGHCDERGTTEYNVALGERRAKATMNYLVSRGVAASRIAIVSYGEERPDCKQHTDACWAQNRRAHFMAKRG